MTSNSEEGFWTQTSGICTIIGLVVGTLLSVASLYFTIFYYRKLRGLGSEPDDTFKIAEIAQHSRPPPPYVLQPNPPPIHDPKGKISSKFLAVVNPFDDANAIPPEVEGKQRKSLLRKKRWLFLFLILLVFLVGGVIGLAANVSKIKKLKYY
jgi:hypothetical protein